MGSRALLPSVGSLLQRRDTLFNRHVLTAAIALIAVLPSQAQTVIILGPTSAGGRANGISRYGQVGSSLLGQQEAMLFNGLAGSWTSLHPAGYDGSEAMDVDGKTQVGWARPVA